MSVSKKKTLVILTNQILTAHNYNVLCCNTKKKNWKIEYWSILPLLGPKIFKKFYDNSVSIRKDKNFKYINNFKELIVNLKKIGRNFYYTNDFNQKLVGLIIDKIFSLKGGKRILFLSGDIAPFLENIKWSQYFSFYFKKKKSKLVSGIFSQLILKPYIFLIKILFSKPKYYFFSNSPLYSKYKDKIGNKKVFGFKHSDILEYNKIKKKIKEKHLVFIDQVRGEEFDSQLNKFFFSPNKNDINNYWRDLNYFFNHLENLFPGKKIKIASHHRRLKKNFPINKKFYFYKTLKLIMESKLVISSSSNSLIFALLMGKPILLVNHKIYENYSFVSIFAVNLLKKYLGSKLINISNIKEISSLNKKSILQINKKKYKKYLKNIIHLNKFENKGNLIEEITKNLKFEN